MSTAEEQRHSANDQRNVHAISNGADNQDTSLEPLVPRHQTGDANVASSNRHASSENATESSEKSKLPTAATTHTSTKVKPEDFEFGCVLGQGAFANVYEVTQTVTGSKFAIKMVDKAFIKRHNKVETVLNERNVLHRLSGHPGIVKLYFTFQDKYSLYYVLELATGGELYDQLTHYGKFEVDSARFYMAELLDIIIYMHSRGVVHRDIKPSNILLSRAGHVKLTDFGTAKILNPDGSRPGTTNTAAGSAASAGGHPPSAAYAAGRDQSASPAVQDPPNAAIAVVTVPGEASVAVEALDPHDAPEPKRENSFVGTAAYVPPELLNDNPVSWAADWWAFGVVLYECLTGSVPFKGESEYQTFQAILKNDVFYPDTFDPDAKDLVSKLLERDASKRLGVHAADSALIRAHPFFKSIDFANAPKSLYSSKAPTYYEFPSTTVDEESTMQGSKGGLALSPAMRARPSLVPVPIQGVGSFSISSKSNSSQGEIRRGSDGLLGPDAGVNNQNARNVDSRLVAMATTSSSSGSKESEKKSSAVHGKQHSSLSGMANANVDTFVLDKWIPYLSAQKSERIACAGHVVKSGKWGKSLFSKRRMLLLTSLPRFVYIDPETMQQKGEIPWAADIRVEKRNDKSFDIHTKARTYYINAEEAPFVAAEDLTERDNPTSYVRRSTAQLDFAGDWIEAINSFKLK